MADSITIEEYKRQLLKPLRPRTICFLVRENEVLLGKRKGGIGDGNWVGIGGKVDPGETIEQAMVREMMEETHVKPTEFEEVTVVDFFFPHQTGPKKWDMRVHAFICKTWEGEPQETVEIFPQWFSFHTLPFESMWPDASFWIPKILEGNKLMAEFLYDKDLSIKEKNIIEI